VTPEFSPKSSASLPQHEYAQRMNRVLDYVDAHLDTTLELSQLASLAHFSPFHFHRMFAAWMGETLGDYVRRRRLEHGAWLLRKRADLSVLQIALTVGFASGEAFARAFKAHFGETPSKWRSSEEERNLDQAERKFDQVFIRCKRDDSGSIDSESLLMNVKLVELPAVRIAYLRHIGPYGESVGRFWGTFHQTRIAHGLSGNMYGIGLDDPAIAPPDKCRYDAAVEIDATTQVKPPFSTTQLPGGRYAIMEYDGDARNIGAAWATLFGQWLPSSGMQCDERPTFEWYRANDCVDEATGRFTCALGIPVAPLSA
jgi:AraC family transcriptional regulator